MLFKKPIFQGTRNLLGNKDRKRLRSTVLTCFPECSETMMDELLFPTNQETTVLKIQGSKIQIYFSQKEPMFFSVDGFEDLFPTCYALTKVPHLISCFLVYPPVSRFLLGGADLMVPGIIVPTDVSCFGFKACNTKQRMGIRVVGNPIPFAVGRCLIDPSGLSHGKGKAVEVLHVFGDQLWVIGGKAIPNQGFSLTQISPSDPPVEEDPIFYPNLLHCNTEGTDPDISPHTLVPTYDNNQTINFKNKEDTGSDDGWEEKPSKTSSNATIGSCTCNVASCNAASCNVASCNAASCNVASCNVASCNAASCNVASCNAASCNVASCNVASCNAASCNVASCNVASCNVASCNVASCNVASCNVASCNVASCNVAPCNVLSEACSEPPEASVDELKNVPEMEFTWENTESSTDHKPAQKETASLSPELMDIFLELVLLETLHSHVLDSACPVSASAVLSRMIPNCGSIQCCQKFRQQLCESSISPETAAGIDSGNLLISCDVKKSSHKKLSKFFQYYTKKKLLQVKEIRGEMTVISINRQSPLYTSYTPLSEKDKKYASKRLVGVQGNHDLLKSNCPENTSCSSIRKTTTRCTEFDVLEFFQPNSNSRIVFETVGITPSVEGKYFLGSQCRTALGEYIKEKELTRAKPSYAMLDEVLKLCVLSKNERSDLKVKQITAPEMEKSEIATRFLANMHVFHALTNVNEDPRICNLKIRRGKLVPIVVQLEKRQGKKCVTTVSNIQVFEIDEKQLAETLQKNLAAAAFTFEIPGLAKGKIKPLGVMVQGSFINQVIDILVKSFGVPRKFITTK